MPSAFDDVRLDEEIERGATGGPIFKTHVVTLVSGHKRRTQVWAQPLGRWDISYGIRSLDDGAAYDGLLKIINFFYARKGRSRTFRFKDWFDYVLTADEQFGTGDGSTTIFQLTKTYTDTGGFTFIKNITKPRQSPAPVIKNNGVIQTEGVDYTIDYSTGLVTFTSPPTNTNPLTWTGEYDKHVAFETDNLDISMDIFYAGSIPAINIMEERA